MNTGHVTIVRTLPETRRKKAELDKRIDVLVQMSERLRDAENIGDFAELRRLADEYSEMGMTRTANQIRKSI